MGEDPAASAGQRHGLLDRRRRAPGRPLRRHVPPHVAHAPRPHEGQGSAAENAGGEGVGASARGGRRRHRRRDGRRHPEPARATGSTAWSRSAATTRSATPTRSSARLPGHRHPQDDGQRRARHRVRPRLRDGADALGRVHQPPAHAPRLERNRRRLPRLRAQRRVHVARDGDGGLRYPLRDTRARLRPRSPLPARRSGPPRAREPLRHGRHLGGRHVEGRQARGVRRGRRLRPPQEDGRRRAAGAGDHAASRNCRPAHRT